MTSRTAPAVGGSTAPVSAPPSADPTCALPLSVATEELTGYEVLKIQVHFNKDLSDLGSVRLLISTVWAYECRRLNKIVAWPEVEAMTLRQLSAYFAPEPSDPDEADELGKDESGTGD